MIIPRLVIFVSICLLVALSSQSALAAKADFPSQFTDLEESYPLRGKAVLSKYFIKGAEIAFYSSDPGEDGVLGDSVTRCLEFVYFRDFSSAQLRDAAWSIINQGWSEKELEDHESDINSLNALYQDVTKGDRYRLIYRPGIGTELKLNGKSLGTVPGAEMSRIYFSIWLGDMPLDDKIRDKLLADLLK